MLQCIGTIHVCMYNKPPVLCHMQSLPVNYQGQEQAKGT